MKSLYEIGKDMEALDHLAEERGGEIGGEVENAFDQWIAELVNDEAQKLANYIGYLKQLEMEKVAAEAEAEQWKKRAKTREARINFLKARMLAHLVATGRTEAVSSVGIKVKVTPNGGALPLVLDPTVDATSLPAEFTETQVRPNAVAIRAALTKGIELSFARLAPRGQHLRIG